VFSFATWLPVVLAHATPELQAPTLIACPEVPYPAGVEGPHSVGMLLLIDERGRVQTAQPRSGEEPFLSVALDAVSRCTFRPAIQDGEPIGVEVPFDWTFDPPAGRVSATVRAAGLNKPVPSMTLTIGDVQATTDTLGRFTVDGLPPGTYEILSASERWRMPTRRINVKAREHLELELWVVEQGQLAGDELVATYDPWSTGGVLRTIRSEEIRATPGSLGDPLRALHNRPGFVRTPFDAGWLLVRGGDFDDTGTYVDGVRVPILYHMGGFTSVLHPEMTDRIRFWPGVHPVRYQATSGAVDAISREVGDLTRVTGGVNTVYAHAFTAVPTRFGGVAVAARRSYLDALLSAVLDPERAAIAPRFWDGQARIEVGDVSILALGLVDNFEAPSQEMNETVTIQQDGMQLQAKIPVDLDPVRFLFAPWTAAQSRRLIEGFSKQAIFEVYPGFRAEFSNLETPAMRWTAGLEAQHRSFRLTQGLAQLTTPVQTVDPYASLSTGDQLVLDAGIRLETLFVRDHLPRAAPSPRATVRWQATRNFALHTGFSRVHGPPIATILYGLPDGVYLDFERADAVSVGFMGSHRTLTLNVDLFHRDLADITAFEYDGSVGQISGFANGIETELHWRVGTLEATALYQFTTSQRREDQDQPAVPAVTDQPHRADILVIEHLPKNWILSSRFRYSTGFPRAPDPISGVPLAPTEAFDILSQRVRPVALSPDAPRLRDFHALDVKMSKRFTFRTWQLDATLDIQNLYNRRIAEPFISGFGESFPAYGFGLPILPIFGVEGLFYPSRQRREAATTP